MGHDRDNAMIVSTRYEYENLETAHSECQKAGLNVSPIAKGGINGIRSFCVFSSGSKAFWEEHDNHLNSLKEISSKFPYSLDWVIVQYGDDAGDQEVIDASNYAS